LGERFLDAEVIVVSVFGKKDAMGQIRHTEVAAGTMMASAPVAAAPGEAAITF
jgi:hypothetical protein